MDAPDLDILDREQRCLSAYLDCFPPPRSGGRRNIGRMITSKVALLVMENFPLGDRFIPDDEVDIALNIGGYPRTLPCGVFLRIREDNRRIIDLLGRDLVRGPCFSARDVPWGSPGVYWISHSPSTAPWWNRQGLSHASEGLLRYLHSFYEALC